jgi:hypothetical protein
MKKSLIHLFAAVALLGITSCVDVPELPYPTPGDDDNPVVSGSLPFTSASLNDFTVQTIKGTPWSLGSSYAKASGYDNNSKVTTATQTWLVSPAINTTMTGTEGIVINFEYVLRYVKSSTDINGYHRLLASTDYDGDVTTATWSNLGFAPVESPTQDWTFYSATPIGLPESLWNEEKVYFAFYFECDGSNSTTWEVNTFSVAEGKADIPDPPTGDDDPQTLPYTQKFETDFGAYTTHSVSGSQEWVIDYKTAKMTGYVAPDYFANEDWLISPRINLTTVSEAHVAMVYIARYFGDIDNEITVWATEGGKESWTQLTDAKFREGSDWITFKNIQFDLGAFVGKQVQIAVKYVSTDSKAGTIEIQSITVAQGKADNSGGDDDDPPVGDEYTVAQVIAANNPGTKGWVKGYIVGTVKDGSTKYEDATFSTDNASQTNLLLADDADCTDRTLCIPVQLPSGNVRTSLNLKDNAGNYKKFVYLYGSLEKYFGVPGLKSVTEFSFDGTGGGGGDDTGGSDPATLPYTADFTKGACDFKAQDLELTGGLTYVWAQSASYGWKASAYKNGNQAAESWLVSPVIDLTSATAPVMTVNHALNYLSGATATDFVNICISTDYTDDATKATWSTLTVPTWPAGTDWNFIDSGDISLLAFAGKKVTVALHYKSTTATAPTWEVKSLSVK